MFNKFKRIVFHCTVLVINAAFVISGALYIKNKTEQPSGDDVQASPAGASISTINGGEVPSQQIQNNAGSRAAATTHAGAKNPANTAVDPAVSVSASSSVPTPIKTTKRS